MAVESLEILDRPKLRGGNLLLALFGSDPHDRLKPLLEEFGVKPSDYEGPGSFASYLLQQAEQHGVEMISLAAEIPGYLQGLNPLSIMAVTRRLARLLNQPID